MKPRQTPQHKKQNAYDKDIRPLVENPHAFRKNWPKKKARMRRLKRRRLHETIRSAWQQGREDSLSPTTLKTVRPLTQIKKDGIQSLRQDVENKLRCRKNRDAA